MATAGTAVFAGLRPKVAPHLLDDRNASNCLDVYLSDGHLRPLKGLAEDGAFSHTPQTIYKWEDGNYWLSFDTRVHIARSINPAIDRLYTTGDGVPKVGNVGDAPGSIFYQTVNGRYPYSMFKLGVPEPRTPPTMTVTVMEPDAERDYTTLDQETRYYIYTYVNEWGEESSPSPVGGPITCYDDSWAEVTVPVGSSSGEVPLSAVRVYRTNTGTESTAFQFVAEYPMYLAASPLPDWVASAYLAEVVETTDWRMPPVDLKYLTLVAGDFYAGVSGREVCLSVSKVPYAWPLAYRFPLEDPPVGMASNGADLVVLTRGRPVVFTGNNPDAVQPIRLAEYQPCLNELSICVYGGMVVYASPDGLIGISSSQGFQNLTADILTREQWQALDPANMTITPFETLLWITTPAGSYLFDLAGGSYTPVSIGYDTAYYDGYTDTLYVTQGATRYKAGIGEDLTYQWVSKHYLLPGTNYCSARVNALSYDDLVFDLLVDGQFVFRTRPRDAEPFRLPPIRGRLAVFQLSGTDTVRSASMATSPGELIL